MPPSLTVGAMMTSFSAEKPPGSDAQTPGINLASPAASLLGGGGNSWCENVVENFVSGGGLCWHCDWSLPAAGGWFDGRRTILSVRQI